MRRRTLLQASGTVLAAVALPPLRAEPSAGSQASAEPVEILGARFEREVKVGGSTLVLNGAGLRRKYVFNVYAAALYLPARTSSLDIVFNLTQPHRIQVVALRDVPADELGKLFVKGMQANATREEFARSIPGTIRIGELFAAKKLLKDGEWFSLDWVPAVGTQFLLNGRSVSEPIREPEFFSALMKIWLGDKPVDQGLKMALLGQANT